MMLSVFQRVRNTFVRVHHRACSVGAAHRDIPNAKTYKHIKQPPGSIIPHLELGTDVFSFSVLYNDMSDWPYPHTEKYKVLGAYTRTGPDVVFRVESMHYHCEVEDDLFGETTETKLEVVEADVSAPTLVKRRTQKLGLGDLDGTLNVPVGFFDMSGHFLHPLEEHAAPSARQIPTETLTEELAAPSTADETAETASATAEVTPSTEGRPQLVVELRRFARKWSRTQDGTEFLRSDCTEVAHFPLKLDEQ